MVSSFSSTYFYSFQSQLQQQIGHWAKKQFDLKLLFHGSFISDSQYDQTFSEKEPNFLMKSTHLSLNKYRFYQKVPKI
jgi:hypothetical protein